MRSYNPGTMMANWLEDLEDDPIDISPFVAMLKARGIYDQEAVDPFSVSKGSSAESDLESVMDDDQSTVTDATDVTEENYIVDLNKIVDYPDLAKFYFFVSFVSQRGVSLR